MDCNIYVARKYLMLMAYTIIYVIYKEIFMPYAIKKNLLSEILEHI